MRSKYQVQYIHILAIYVQPKLWFCNLELLFYRIDWEKIVFRVPKKKIAADSHQFISPQFSTLSMEDNSRKCINKRQEIFGQLSAVEGLEYRS